MIDLSARSPLLEIMDRPDVPAKELHKNLHELEVINKWLGGFDVVINALEQLPWNGQTVTIIDVGCGGGDTLRAISQWAEKKGRPVNLIGVDRNAIMTDYATMRSENFSNIRFLTVDVFNNSLLDEKADIVINSLFCHHFDTDNLVRLLSRMLAIANKTVIINDLCRHWFAYYSIKILTAFFSGTYIVKHDAPLSVARALTKAEWENILKLAKIDDYQLKWKWAWRWQIIITKPVNHAG